MAILGNLEKVKQRYFPKGFEIVFNYLMDASQVGSEVHNRIFNLQVGAFEKVPINDHIFALEQTYFTKDRKDCFVESHRDYIDFQLHLFGVEQMEYCDINELKMLKEYDNIKDLILYKEKDDMSKFVMKQDCLAVFFPEDGHMGLPHLNNEKSLVRKTVVKFPVSLFNN